MLSSLPKLWIKYNNFEIVTSDNKYWKSYSSSLIFPYYSFKSVNEKYEDTHWIL